MKRPVLTIMFLKWVRVNNDVRIGLQERLEVKPSTGFNGIIKLEQVSIRKNLNPLRSKKLQKSWKSWLKSFDSIDSKYQSDVH